MSRASSQTVQERTLYVGHETMFRSAPIKFIIASLFAPVGIGLIVLGRWWWRAMGTTLTVTTSRITLRRGILSRSINEVLRANVRNVRVNQSFLQRLLGVGYIGISSSGQSDIEIEVHGVRDPMRVKRLIDSPTSADAVSTEGFDKTGAIVFGVSVVVSSFVLYVAINIFSGAAKDIAGELRAIDERAKAAAEQRRLQEIAKPQIEQQRPSIAAPDVMPVEEAATAPVEQVETVAIDESSAEEKKPNPDVADEAKAKREKQAAGKLSLAKPLIGKNDKGAAKRLKEIVDDFDGTPAAEDAKQLLQKLQR